MNNFHRTKNYRTAIYPAAATLIYSVSLAAAVPMYTTDKDLLDARTQAVIVTQDAFLERGSSYPNLPLQRRTIKSFSGISPALQSSSPSPSNPVDVIVKLSEFPNQAMWSLWHSKGVEYLEYMGQQYWLVQINTDLNQAYELMRANSFSEYLTTDKIAAVLDTYQNHPEFYHEDKKSLVLDVQLRSNNTDNADALLAEFHKQGYIYEDQSDGQTITLVIDADRLTELANRRETFFIHPGSWRKQELMQKIRSVVNANPALGLENLELTGKGIRLANNEGIGGGIHPDFWDHNSWGEPIQGRWTPLAQGNCLNGGAHGMMTAGVLMGNGWLSQSTELDIDEPYEFKGLAPNATFECYHTNEARAHTSSHSYVQSSVLGLSFSYNTIFDKRILGLTGNQYFHPQTVAIGNNGLNPNNESAEKGYFSTLNPYKNQMGVGNGQVSGLINPGSSMGPTFDGRIKPDVVAPTGTHGYEGDVFKLEIAHINIKRNNQIIYQWSFDDNTADWHMGWGNTNNLAFGLLFSSMNQTNEGALQLSINQGPWGTAWQNKPLVGTQVIPYDNPNGGAPINFIGHADDVLNIKYRTNSSTAGIFELYSQWFRSFPITVTEDWYSHGQEHVYAMGDGQWNQASIPVGESLSYNTTNEPWTNPYSWQAQPIQYLALRFRYAGLQLTPNNDDTYQFVSGTSGASPVVAGSYALALEHLTNLYPQTNLDYQGKPSVYYSNNQEGKGPVLNSTLKALFVHTANDMTSDGYPTLPNNPDTTEPTTYQSGPDYVTGYGMIDTQKAIDLMTLDQQNQQSNLPYEITENTLEHNGCDVYEINVTKNMLRFQNGLKATLVWDDASASSGSNVTVSKLVNNIGLFLKDPAGNYYYPWSIDLPYDIQSQGIGPHQIEPEPINSTDMVAARRDIPNDRDNVEQVLIDNVSIGEAGIWKAFVVDNGIATELGQKYSIVISPIEPLVNQ